MIIDMHFHPFCKEATWQDLDKVATAMWGTDSEKINQFLPLLEGFAKETSINDFIAMMDVYNIDKAVAVSFNVQSAYGVTIVTNDDLKNMVDQYPDRLIGFAGVDVPATDAIKQLEYAIGSLELKGVKIVPPVQKFDITDSKYDSFFQKILDYNIPLWTHTGHQVSTVGSIAKFGHPQLIDELALKFPNLIIIMGHMGIPWFWDAFSVVLRHPNVYVDISAHPHFFSYFPFDLFTAYDIEDKVLFASDHPLSPWPQHMPAVEALTISKSFREKMMGENAAKILRINDK